MGKNSANIVTAGWPIPETLKESFTDFCREKGTIVQEDAAGALLVWQYLPAYIREIAKLQAKGLQPVDADFWQALYDSLDGALAALKEIHKRKHPDKILKSGKSA